MTGPLRVNDIVKMKDGSVATVVAVLYSGGSAKPETICNTAVQTQPDGLIHWGIPPADLERVA